MRPSRSASGCPTWPTRRSRAAAEVAASVDTVDLLAITAPLLMENGTARNTGAVPGLISVPAPSKAARGRERDFFFAHLSLSGPAEEKEALVEETANDLARRFFQTSGSVTSALRRAVIETNEQLLRRNITVRSPHEGALTCAVLHGDELYTLQVGEGLAFLGHNFGVERLPVQMPRHLTPLGRSAGIDIRFAYHRLQSGDMMLLADPRLAYLTGMTLSPALVDTEIESGLEALTGIMSNDSARLLLVEFADELPSTLPLSFQHSKKAAAPPRPIPAAPVAKAIAGPPSPTPPTPAAGAIGNPASVPASAAAGPVASAVDTDTDTDSVAALETGARRVASSSARSLSRFTAWLADLLGRLRGGQPAESSVNWVMPAMIAVVIPVVVAAVVTSVYLQRGNNEELAVIKQQMLEAMTLAGSAGGDSTETRVHYETVLALSAEAEALRPGDVEVARMRAEAREALDRIDGVTRMTGRAFYQFEPGVNLTRIILGLDSGSIAVLDQANGRVLLHETDESFLNPPEEEPVAIAFTGQSVGTEVVGPLVDLLWLPGSSAQTRDGVAMLDRTGVLFSYFPNLDDIRGVRLGNSSAWLNPLAMGTYLGRLYVLDSGAGQIWKYFADQGYEQLADDPAIFFSAQAGLDQAVDFDLYSEDGSLVVIYNDGRIRYYDTRSGRVQWDETTLLQNGLSSPFVSPVSVKLVGRGLNASIFVLDPGSSRLVQLSRGGTVLTQYRILDAAGNEVLSRAGDFAVVDSPLRVFVAAGEQIYLAER